MSFEEVDLQELIKKKRENDPEFDKLWKERHNGNNKQIGKESRI